MDNISSAGTTERTLYETIQLKIKSSNDNLSVEMNYLMQKIWFNGNKKCSNSWVIWIWERVCKLRGLLART